jgi:hypothetical protein
MTEQNENRNLEIFEFNTVNYLAQSVRRDAEFARAEYLLSIAKSAGLKITSVYRSVTNLLWFIQRMNQAARL